MSAGELPAASTVPTGNTFDKYGSSNPLVRRLMARFEHAVAQLIERAAPESILDVGCGEGVLTFKLAEQQEDATVVGLDLPDPTLEAHWRSKQRPNLRFLGGTAEALPFERDAFDLVTAIETLEHLPEPDRALREMTRVARRHLLVSVPREPLWRALNLARGAYLTQLGNTPGHVNHFSRREVQRLLAERGELVEVLTPAPWTVVLVRVS